MPVTILMRQQLEVNTDPQRRCYNGCHASSELVWTSWGVLERGLTPETVDRRVAFWQELNDYAVSQRGKSARRYFKITEEPL
jgi:hypothetical protein